MKNVKVISLKICLVLVSAAVMAQPAAPDKAVLLSQELASKLAAMPLKCIGTEWPNMTGHKSAGEADHQLLPSELHPSFYGCLDWHSSVHGHWMLVRLLKLFPDLDQREKVLQVLGNSFKAEKLRAEAGYFSKYGNMTFERTYGWAWLLKLDQELGVVAHIYHATVPRFFARIEKLGVAEPISELGYRGINIVFSYGLDDDVQEDYVMIVENNLNKADHSRLIRPLQKAVEWYMHMAGRERKARNLHFSMLEDYSPETPGLQIMFFAKTQEFLLSHEKGVVGFASMEELDEYMEEVLKLPSELISGGVINGEIMPV